MNVLFLVQGHSKIACDKPFDLIVQHYYKCQACKYKQACELLNTHDDIDVLISNDFTFMDWHALEEKYFR